MTAVVVVLCTAPAAGGNGGFSAERLARTVVEEGLCACVNVVPGVRSFFRWEGRVDVADEQLLGREVSVRRNKKTTQVDTKKRMKTIQ